MPTDRPDPSVRPSDEIHRANQPPAAFSTPDESAGETNFAGLYRLTVAPLRRYLARLLRDSSEAQDVSHDAYLRVYPLIKEDRARKPEALLYTTARRLALNRIKRRQIAPFVGETARPEIAPSSAPGVVQQVIARQELDRLRAAIAQLPPGCRQVLLLRKIELMSHQEIASRLGISISTVEKQHARALRLLRAACIVEAGPAAAAAARPGGKENPS